MNNPIQHPELAQLIDFIEARTPQLENDQLVSHLKTCTMCAESFRRMEEMLHLMRTDDSQDAPRDLVSFAVGLFKPKAKDSHLRRLVAVLSFDSYTSKPAFGVRSGQTTTRQMLYTAAETEIDLRIARENETWIVSGQLLGHDCVKGLAKIDGSNLSESADINEFCEFKLPPVPAGEYNLSLSFPDFELEVPRLELHA